MSRILIERPRVVVALSGGVDSAAAAALLVEQGYEVIGIMLRLWADEARGCARENRCCSPEAVEDARRVCQVLNIPFYLLNAEQPFKEIVVDYFVAEYSQCRTPNPCIVCNLRVKFGYLLERALSLDAQYLATGHYARVDKHGETYRLLRGADAQKDQSYVLYALGQDKLRHAFFPLGNLTKAEARATAVSHGLPVAGKAESQEICFLPDGDYRQFLTRWAPLAGRPGPIVDTAGRVVGQHRGLPFYTIGQRHGLGIANPKPLYVVAMNPGNNELVVGPADEVWQGELMAGGVSWVSGKHPDTPARITAKTRYRSPESPATLFVLGGGQAGVVFDQPQRAITPGQAVVFYQGEEVLGGGTIERAAA
ncbi:MAG: tRNA 2-thiouridine(34) synthase MnmA [Chloroflexi bacterium]|nr:tRNA 2-thiouridine(34) synthase MnmA [Chloroflexota bacterium]